jgi:hypothetical protein
LINKGLLRLPEWKRVGKRGKCDFGARFPKVIHKFFHKEDVEIEIFSGLRRQLFSGR